MQYWQNFGSIQARKHDMGTPVMTAILQGANVFYCVRVTDGTETYATGTLTAASLAVATITAKYTGSLGNQITTTLQNGSKADTYQLIVAVPGSTPEIFDNLSTYDDIASAVNNGIPQIRNPSQWITATSSSTDVPTANIAVTLTGGTDGAASITPTILIGQDQTSGQQRTGMYALRDQPVSIGVLSDLDTLSSYTTVGAFAVGEGVYFIGTGPQSDATANVVAVAALKRAAAIDDYSIKIMFGDWPYWNDPVVGLTRLVSPQGFEAGRLAALSPEQSSLNKRIYGIQGTLRTGLNQSQNTLFTYAEKQVLGSAGIDLICAPANGGAYYAPQFGHNSSSDARNKGDNYTRMFNYVAETINKGAGLYIGVLNNEKNRRSVKATLDLYFGNLFSQGMLSLTNDGKLPWLVTCDSTNNPQSMSDLGYLIVDIKVKLTPIVEFLVFNLELGQTVNLSTNA
jgi:hypothetical protein